MLQYKIEYILNNRIIMNQFTLCLFWPSANAYKIRDSRYEIQNENVKIYSRLAATLVNIAYTGIPRCSQLQETNKTLQQVLLLISYEGISFSCTALNLMEAVIDIGQINSGIALFTLKLQTESRSRECRAFPR